jgi:hypothetical protein
LFDTTSAASPVSLVPISLAFPRKSGVPTTVLDGDGGDGVGVDWTSGFFDFSIATRLGRFEILLQWGRVLGAGCVGRTYISRNTCTARHKTTSGDAEGQEIRVVQMDMAEEVCHSLTKGKG